MRMGKRLIRSEGQSLFEYVLLVALIVIVVVAFIVIYRSKPSVAVAQQPATPVSTMPEGEDARRLNFLEHRVNDMERDIETLVHSDSDWVLARLDRDIKAIETGVGQTHGSFTDWFLPELNAARHAGASRKEINSRLDKVYALAKQGKYFSGYLDEIDHLEPGALREYFNAIKKK